MENRIKAALLERGLIADESKDLIIKTADGKEVSVTQLVVSLLEPVVVAQPAPLPEPVLLEQADTRAEQMAKKLFITSYVRGYVQDGNIDEHAGHCYYVASRFYETIDAVQAQKLQSKDLIYDVDFEE